MSEKPCLFQRCRQRGAIFDSRTQPFAAQVRSPPGSRGSVHPLRTLSNYAVSSLPLSEHVPHFTSHPFCLSFCPLEPACSHATAQREAAFSSLSIPLNQVFWPSPLWPQAGWSASSMCLDSRPVRGSC